MTGTYLNINIIIILAAIGFALFAIYILYAIIMFKGTDNKSNELQLSTKNALEQVKKLFDAGEYALVELLASKYLDRVPSNQEVRQYLAEAYYNDRKYNNSIKQCLTVLKKDPDNIDTRKVLGDCYIKKGLLNKAVKEYESIFDSRSHNKDVVRTLAELYRDTDQLYSSITVYNILSDLMTQNDDIAEVQGILAELNEEVHDYPAAFDAYKSRLTIYPTDVQTNQNLTSLYIKIQNAPKAIETLLYMLGFVNEPKTLLWVYDHLVQLYVETGEYEKAIEYSNKLLEVQGSDKFKVRTDIATFYLKLENFSNGINILEDLVMMSQSAYDVTVQLAKAYIETKEYEKALEKYTVLLDKSTPREAKNVRLLICELYIDWAIDKAKDHKYDESFKYLDLAQDFNTINPEVYYNKAINNFELKNFNAAVDFLNRALEYDKFNTYHTKYLLKLSEAHHNLGNFFEEKKALSDLLKIDENNAMGLYRSGLMYISQHDIKNAEDFFTRALENDPTLTPAKYNLALIYENNNKDRAKELYMEVLEEDPSFEEAKNALADLSSSDY